ncbi:anti-sigma-F factor Fin [Alicyclobacillus dauci]|uniref:Anti-sigma-F factor Fin family protein n=1 Tax=Alicyclobacillus dauci TaxID=1475485 RepID=A0ABY6Z558_9BACL|nr:anti-sigma-F factor Fin [Alicyclobacillus dauci]WAH37331.1 anti-sigma-F factor Fin family protein [Alicyclobacillus dauci]
MRFEYVCRYCKQPVGAVEEASWTYDDGAERLGLHHLDTDHQREVIRAGETGSVQVQTVCEACEQAVNMNPELLVEGNIIQ